MTTDRTDGDHVVEWLDAWRTGELDAERAAAVGAHLEACPDCRAALADVEAFATAVEAGYRDAEAARPEPDWGARRAAIVERTSARGEGRPPWIVRWAPQVAIVAVAVVAIGVLVEQGVRAPGDAERALRAPAERTAPAPAPVPSGEAAGEPPIALEDDADEAGPPAARPEPGVRDDRDGALDRAPEDERAPEERRPAAEPAAPADAAVEQQEALAEREARIEPEAGRAAAMEKAAPDRGERFRSRARSALAARDSSAVVAALEFWGDSVEVAELPAARRASLEALADSLAAFLASRP